ncbi:tail fiber assembly protein [Pseudomonas sp. OVF7]|uniref:tail fiber assembly protein n=1 Tax=unclassified Pseudomonas TaxID=196821 RepID=UPI00272A35A8|nr:tail fiber assembly protein [Pseudomonas sp. OVF7]WLD64695.1 tail fiber assembly protein [Pseudomonas sp. OVF7]
MKLLISNNGFYSTNCDENYVPNNDEAVFESWPSDDEMLLAFPNRNEYIAQMKKEELSLAATAESDRRLGVAAIRIAPLQDAVDLKKPDANIALLAKWKQYRIDVGAISEQKGFPTEIVWPVEPNS